MKNFFKLDAPVFRFLSKVGSLILLSLCWLICSLPVFTLGAATAAMFRGAFDLRDDKEGVFKSFFRAFCRDFKLATLVWLLLLGCGLVAYCIPQIAAILGSGLIVMAGIGATCAVYLILWLVMVCIFPLIAYFDNTLKKTLRNAVFIAIKHRKHSITCAILTAIPVVVFLALPDIFLLTSGLWLLIYPGVISYFIVCRFAPIFLEYGNRRKENKETEEEV